MIRIFTYLVDNGSYSKLYVRCYKFIYLILIIANLFLRIERKGWPEILNDEILFIPVINALTILINIASFILLETGFRVAIVVEKILSAVRMVTLFFLASLIFTFFIVFVIPTGDIFWYPFLVILNLPIWLNYLTAAILFALEFLFFKKLSSYKASSTI